MFLETLSPFLQDIVLALVGLITTLIIAVAVELRKRVLTWIDNRNSIRTQEILHTLAEQSFHLIEAKMKESSSTEKLNEAIYYVSKRAEARGINISTDEVRAEIERVVRELNYKLK
ncbi:phage holin, LLH family [Alkalihalophilus pseudofirmus]|uniref:phage holin, LLH family n=1 Tax=Alkalihalophilus pseudofirmus TaxID=79885 RepID=UPI00259B9782|nr:phage holin, LLH family [Alkalihalophilus pseudofirmus]WEG18466.1 phage holin, LLH family [Alkalihalophilus pseudofirmus]